MQLLLLMSMGKPARKLLVVGNGMVGHRFCEKFQKLGGLASYEMTVFGEENFPAYDRVNLSAYFKTQKAEDLFLGNPAWYVENGIQLISGRKIVAIDTQAKRVRDNLGGEHAYDTLVLATGSSAFVPPLAGVDRKGVFVYRTIDDLRAMIEYSKECKHAAVIGGGLLGLEAAKTALDLGLKPHVVEFAARLMPRQLDEMGATLLKDKIESLGISVHTGVATKEIIGAGAEATSAVTGLALQDGRTLDVEMVIVSAGIRPRDELAKPAGISVGERGGIVVDNNLKTSAPDVYCIGEAALHNGMIYGLVAPGYEMAEIAASNILGEQKYFLGFDMSTKLKLIGVDVASFGDAFAAADGARAVTFLNQKSGVYKKLVVNAEGKRLLGGILVGDASEYGQLYHFMENGTVLPDQLEALIFSGTTGAMPEIEMADSAQICKCNAVTKGDLVKAIEGGCGTPTELKKCTGAGTGCGGCMPFVGDVLKTELKKLGKVTNTNLCEHFAMSRQDLFAVIKIKKLNNFADVIRAAGKGLGCDICKPAVASILSSIHSHTAARHSTSQDTNDRFMANIQRGGTYSIVPRIPGGEILPDKLITLGEIAKKYDLYCKITGGQRIDLFGARIDQLPEIWEELIAAGFESGHAYAKALRTVKSCVGSTWCRFGVQDSTSMAIRIEERYKGLRAPHKIKSAVSGCIRECAEAQSKDFGLIATEKGWNLYICGNGGVTPQHAVLFAADIDGETAIRYIDRFLIYYIRTADRLQRTAWWLNGFEGGVDHLREIIIEDSLGICAELEAEMEAHVGRYSCEWKEVVKSPELRHRFRQLVNAPVTEDAPEFIRERGQKRPADWDSHGTNSQPVMAGVTK